MTSVNPKWDRRFLRLAREVSGWSKDPSTRVGAVVVDPCSRNVLSIGYNGFPRRIADTEARYMERSKKYALMVHGEMNAIYNATSNGVSLRGGTIYVYGLCICEQCALGIIQVGIKRVVYFTPNPSSQDRWAKSTGTAKQHLEEAGVKLYSYSDIEVNEEDKHYEL